MTKKEAFEEINKIIEDAIQNLRKFQEENKKKSKKD